MNKIFLSVILLSVILFSSCSPARKAIRAPIKEEGAEYLFKKLKESELKFNWLSAKFSADYENKNKTNSFNGQIRIRKDSLIWISLTPMLGIEAVRIMISQDSVKMINRLNDTYFIGNYEYVNRFLNTNIDFDILQAFLIGTDLQFYEDGKFRASVEQGLYRLSTMERQKLRKFARNNQDTLKVYIQNIWLDPQSYKILQADVKEIRKDKLKLEARYNSFEEIENQLFPKQMEYIIRAENTIHIEADFSRIVINIPLQFPFKIPDGYQPLK